MHGRALGNDNTFLSLSSSSPAWLTHLDNSSISSAGDSGTNQNNQAILRAAEDDSLFIPLSCIKTSSVFFAAVPDFLRPRAQPASSSIH